MMSLRDICTQAGASCGNDTNLLDAPVKVRGLGPVCLIKWSPKEKAFVIEAKPKAAAKKKAA